MKINEQLKTEIEVETFSREGDYKVFGIDNAADECEKILTNISIQFAEWLRHNCVISSDEGFYFDDESYSAKEMFAIFKTNNNL